MVFEKFCQNPLVWQKYDGYCKKEGLVRIANLVFVGFQLKGDTFWRFEKYQCLY